MNVKGEGGREGRRTGGRVGVTMLGDAGEWQAWRRGCAMLVMGDRDGDSGGGDGCRGEGGEGGEGGGFSVRQREARAMTTRYHMKV